VTQPTHEVHLIVALACDVTDDDLDQHTLGEAVRDHIMAAIKPLGDIAIPTTAGGALAEVTAIAHVTDEP
jgi:hypothetical protein